MERGRAAGRFEGRAARAAAFETPDQPTQIETVGIAKPGSQGALVKLVASGVCHSGHHLYTGSGRPTWHWCWVTTVSASSKLAGLVSKRSPSMTRLSCRGRPTAVAASHACPATRSCAGSGRKPSTRISCGTAPPYCATAVNPSTRWPVRARSPSNRSSRNLQ
jgi:hypothetical protein